MDFLIIIALFVLTVLKFHSSRKDRMFPQPKILIVDRFFGVESTTPTVQAPLAGQPPRIFIDSMSTTRMILAIEIQGQSLKRDQEYSNPYKFRLQ
jgi:hypothetical protein